MAMYRGRCAPLGHGAFKCVRVPSCGPGGMGVTGGSRTGVGYLSAGMWVVYGWVGFAGLWSWGVVAFLAGSGVGVLRRGGSLCAIGAGQHDTFTSCGLTPLRAILRKVHRSHQTCGMHNGNHIPRSWIGPVADPNLHDNTARNSRPTPGQDLDYPLNQTVRYSDWSHSLDP